MDLDKILVLSIVLLFLVPPAVFGVADIENKDILAESKDGQIVLSLSFGDNLISKFNRVIPTLQSGLLVIGDTILEIENARTKIMGNSFVVHSEDILIYVKGLENDNFLINSYLVGNNQLDPIKLRTVTIQPDVPSGIEKNLMALEMIVMVQQDTKTFWNDNYDIAIKVFDKATNPNPQFYQSLGAINKAEIEVILKDIDGEELTQLSGQTNSKGFWEGDYFVLQKLVSGGVYYVQVNVTYLESNNTQIFETFIFSDTRDAKSSG